MHSCVMCTKFAPAPKSYGSAFAGGEVCDEYAIRTSIGRLARNRVRSFQWKGPLVYGELLHLRMQTTCLDCVIQFNDS